MIVPTAAVAVVGSAMAVVINLATEWKTEPWAWVAVALLTAVAAGVGLWLSRAQTRPQPGLPESGGDVSRSAIGTFEGSTVITGDGNQVQR